jgi:polysaccharide pyruvyl transferase CsaB
VTRIGIIGSYGGLNLGDEAILTSMICSLRSQRDQPELVVFSRNTAHTESHHAVDQVVDARLGERGSINETLGSLDLLLLGGGGLLYDGEADLYLRDVRAAQRCGVPTFAFAIGAGPLTSAQDRATVREVVSAMDGVTVRDQESKRVLEQSDVEAAIEVTADPSLLMAPLPFTESALIAEGIPPSGRLIGMSVREPGRAAPDLDENAYHLLLASLADFVVHRYEASVVFVPMERQDLSHSHAVISHMVSADRARVLNGCYDPRVILGLMEHFDFAVGMRLHFLIFAALSGVPFLPLPYAGKVYDFAQAAGVPALHGVSRE